MRLGEDICVVATLQHLRVLGVGCFGGPCMKLSVYISYCNKAQTAHSNHPFCNFRNVSICHVQVDPTMVKGELIINCNIIYTLL